MRKREVSEPAKKICAPKSTLKCLSLMGIQKYGIE
jgi:hypothetical protein